MNINDKVIGSCSICGGLVIIPAIWHAATSPVATCEGCGAVEASHGPVIPMMPGPDEFVQLIGWAPERGI